MSKIRFFLLIVIICLAASGCKKKEEKASGEELPTEPEVLKEFVIEDDRISSIATVLGQDRILSDVKYLNVEPPTATPSDVEEGTSETAQKGDKKETTADKKETTADKKETAKDDKVKETTTDNGTETLAFKKLDTKPDRKTESKAETRTAKEETTTAAAKETKADKKEETKADKKEETEDGDKTEEEPIPDPDDDGQKKVIYTFHYLEDGSEDAKKYIQYLIDKESFISQWDYYPDAPAGYVSLLKDSASNRWNFQVDIDYTKSDVKVILTKWKKPEEPKATSSAPVRTLSTQGSIDYLTENFTPQDLGLDVNKPLSEYSLIPNPGRSFLDKTEYFVVHVYNNLPNNTNTIAGTYYVSSDATKVLRYDFSNDTFAEVKGTKPKDATATSSQATP